MKNTQEIFKTSEKKIKQIISDDLNVMHSFRTYLEKRQELEQNFADEMSQYIKSGNRNNSSASSLIYDEMFAVFAHHKDLANDIKVTFIPPIISIISYLDKEEKKINESIQKAENSIGIYEKKLFKARSQVETAKLEQLRFSSTKADILKRNVKLYEQELQIVENDRDAHLKNLFDIELPNWLQSASELDFSVRTTIKNSMLNLTHLEISASERLAESLQAVNVASARYEPSSETMILAKSLGLLSSQHKIYAIVRCNYSSDNHNDLTISRGELIEIINQHPSGWWEGECNGRRGLFPMNFVEVITDVESGALSIQECFEIEGFHLPVQEGELKLELGDVVFVATLKDGWCEGYKFGTDERGRFPGHIVRYVKHLRQWMRQDP